MTTERLIDEARQTGWLIHKEGRGWYRPKSQGYTSRPEEAGRYSYKDALSYSHPNGWSGPRDGITIRHESDIGRRAAPADDLRAENARLRDVIREMIDCPDDAAEIASAALSQPAPAPQFAVQMPPAWLDVMGERTRQMAVEGWTPEHDDKHDQAQMVGAALCYLAEDIPHWAPPQAQGCYWPWDAEWWKPTDPRRNLVKAGALILAEIERLDRAALAANGRAPVTDRQLRDQIVGEG